MLKIHHYGLSLLLLAATVSLTADPVRAESKLSQCKRFDQTINRAEQQLAPAIKQISAAKTAETYTASVDQLLRLLKQNLKQIEARQFSDRQIQSFQNQTVGLYTDGYNHLVNLINAFDDRDRSRFIQSGKKLDPLAARERKLMQQVHQYCSAKSA